MSGKRVELACGHEGEVVVGDFAVCTEGCEEAIPYYIQPEKTEPIVRCVHAIVYQMLGSDWCKYCGAKVVIP